MIVKFALAIIARLYIPIDPSKMLRLQLNIYDERRYNRTCRKVFLFNFPFTLV